MSSNSDVNPAEATEGGMDLFGRYLSVWVALAIVAGVALGQLAPSIPETLSRFEYAQVSIPIAIFFFSSRRRHTRLTCDWSSDVCSSDLAMTGESMPVEKFPRQQDNHTHNPLDLDNILFMGTNVVSGTAMALILTTGNNTYRSEERRVGKECRSRRSPYHEKKTIKCSDIA